SERVQALTPPRRDLLSFQGPLECLGGVAEGFLRTGSPEPGKVIHDARIIRMTAQGYAVVLCGPSQRGLRADDQAAIPEQSSKHVITEGQFGSITGVLGKFGGQRLEKTESL